jgi:hypothetical protein
MIKKDGATLFTEVGPESLSRIDRETDKEAATANTHKTPMRN